MSEHNSANLPNGFKELPGDDERDPVPPPRSARPRTVSEQLQGKGQYHPDGRVRGSAQPIPGKCGRKLQGSDPPRYCTQWPLRGHTCCKFHGGKSLAGRQAAAYKDGRRSRYIQAIPAKLKKSFETALNDKELLDLREDVALIQIRIEQLLKDLGATEKLSSEEDIWDKIMGAIQLKSHITQMTIKHILINQEWCSVEQVVALLQFILDTIHNRIRCWVDDEYTGNVIISEITRTIHDAIPNPKGKHQFTEASIGKGTVMPPPECQPLR